MHEACAPCTHHGYIRCLPCYIPPPTHPPTHTLTHQGSRRGATRSQRSVPKFQYLCCVGLRSPILTTGLSGLLKSHITLSEVSSWCAMERLCMCRNPSAACSAMRARSCGVTHPCSMSTIVLSV
jgi:hypothetical protein